MPGTRKGNKKSAVTMKRVYGATYFKKLGKKGGKTTARRYFGKK